MKLVVTQENLNRALQNVSRIASAKTPLPILNNILLRTENNMLFIAATNLEIAITEYIGAKVSKQGSITIPARLITEFIHNLPKDTVTLEVKDQHLHIKTEKHSSIINGLGVDEFPELPIINEKKAITLTLHNNSLKSIISKSIIASSSDTTRPMLTGVFFHTHRNTLYTVATDGYRLAECKVQPQKDNISAIIPVTSLQEVLRLIHTEDDETTILFDENQARFRVEKSEITSKLIDAEYVDYRQLIPQSSETTILINKNEFSRIVKIASLFARESAGGITISADSKKGVISIHSIASQLGENTSEAAATITGGGTITLNSRYLIDALNVIDDDEVTFQFSGKLSPCVVTSTNQSLGYQHIIMPLKS